MVYMEIHTVNIHSNIELQLHPMRRLDVCKHTEKYTYSDNKTHIRQTLFTEKCTVQTHCQIKDTANTTAAGGNVPVNTHKHTQ